MLLLMNKKTTRQNFAITYSGYTPLKYVEKFKIGELKRSFDSRLPV
jgi:hypothetical protein